MSKNYILCAEGKFSDVRIRPCDGVVEVCVERKTEHLTDLVAFRPFLSGCCRSNEVIGESEIFAGYVYAQLFADDVKRHLVLERETAVVSYFESNNTRVSRLKETVAEQVFRTVEIMPVFTVERVRNVEIKTAGFDDVVG